MHRSSSENRKQRRTAVRVLAAILCIVSLLLAEGALPMAAPYSQVWADTTGYVDTGNGGGLNVRSGPSTSYNTLFWLNEGTELTILSTVSDGNGGSIDWYQISCYLGTGYVRSDFVRVSSGGNGGNGTDDDFEAYLDAQGFPESYCVSLRRLHAIYPNWKFVAKHTGLDWSAALARECMPGVSLVEDTAAKPWIQLDSSGNMVYYDSGYVQATAEAVAFYMDPRNCLSPKAIFQFLSDKYDPDTQTLAGLQGVISTSFLSRTFPESGYASYAELLMYAGRTYNVNPLTLASKIILEQGWSGGSDSISGTVSGYEGLYNHFNIGAYSANGRSAIENGLIYARNKGWTSRTKSILGGSSWFAAEYVNAGQYTLYYQRWNVLNGLSSVGTYQYMTAVHGSYSTALTKASGYMDASGELKNDPLTFEIPVYLNMPASACPAPGTVFDFTLDTVSKTVPVGSSYGFLARLTNKDLGPVTVTSSDTSVATAFLKDRNDGRGFYFELTGLKKGSAVITVTYGGVSKTLNVTVFDYELDNSSKKIAASKGFGFLAKLSDRSFGEVTVYSSDPDIATVYLKDPNDSRGFYFEGWGLYPGTAVITVKYAGITKTLPVTVTELEKETPSIQRISGSNRYATAFDAAETLKAVRGIETFDNIIVADGRDFPDALAGSYLASKVSSSGASPILLTSPGAEDETIGYISENLTPGGRVYILGGEGAVPSSFEEKLAELAIESIRLAGANRYATDLAILQAAGPDASGNVLICSGTDFADSLSASSLGLPLLIVGNSLTQDQLAYLKSTASGTCFIVGGTGAVSQSVQDTLNANGFTTERIAGSDRMRTSLALAERFFGDSDKAVLAYAFDYPDGLTGSPIACQIGAPIILTDGRNIYTARRYVRCRAAEVTGVYVMGGSALISETGVENICGDR